MVARSRMSLMMASSVREEAEMSFRYSRCLLFSSPVRGLDSSSLKPMMLVSGVLQLVGHVADELALEAVGRHQRLVALDQSPLVALGVGHVGEGDERGAVGQRRDGEVDRRSGRAAVIWPGDRLPPVGDARDSIG